MEFLFFFFIILHLELEAFSTDIYMYIFSTILKATPSQKYVETQSCSSFFNLHYKHLFILFSFRIYETFRTN